MSKFNCEIINVYLVSKSYRTKHTFRCTSIPKWQSQVFHSLVISNYSIKSRNLIIDLIELHEIISQLFIAYKVADHHFENKM